MQEILKAEGLKKYFGKVKAVDGVDFSVSQGGLVALLGQNGAGKSTNKLYGKKLRYWTKRNAARVVSDIPEEDRCSVESIIVVK